MSILQGFVSGIGQKGSSGSRGADGDEVGGCDFGTGTEAMLEVPTALTLVEEHAWGLIAGRTLGKAKTVFLVWRDRLLLASIVLIGTKIIICLVLFPWLVVVMILGSAVVLCTMILGGLCCFIVVVVVVILQFAASTWCVARCFAVFTDREWVLD